MLSLGARALFLRRSFCSNAKLKFVYDAENEVPLFYANKLGSNWYEQDYHTPFQEKYREICDGEGVSSYGGLEYSMLDPLVCIAAMQAIGRVPASREIGICTVPKVFHEKKCYWIQKWRGKDFWYHHVRLKPLELESLLVREEIIKSGVARRTRYMKLKASLDSAAVKHGVEVELSKQTGCNFVIFLSKQEMGRRSAISRELSRAGVCVDDLKLEMWKPEDDSFYEQTLRKKKTLTRKRETTINLMKERLLHTHCRTGPRSEAQQEPVKWYEEVDSQPLYRHHFNFDSDKVVVELDTESWNRNKEAIPWEERMTSKPGGKITEVLKIVEIDGNPAELMIPRRRMRGWSVSRIQTRVPRSNCGGENVKFTRKFLER